MATYCGIDGCSAGWLAIWTHGNNYKYGVYPSIADLKRKHPELEVCLIDVPIGLSSSMKRRTIDSKMRKELKGRASTVFTAPSRMAAYADGYEAAKSENLKIEGKSLSKQAYCITPKIREIDEFILSKPPLKLIEAHPEISFKYLNGGKTLLSKKSKEVGIRERLSILEKYNRKIPDLYKKIVENTLRKHVKRDDIVDAICLSVSMEMGRHSLKFISDENFIDGRGIEIKIGYFDPN